MFFECLLLFFILFSCNTFWVPTWHHRNFLKKIPKEICKALGGQALWELGPRSTPPCWALLPVKPFPWGLTLDIRAYENSIFHIIHHSFGEKGRGTLEGRGGWD